MTDKKILDAEKIADEVLSDGELDKVAGGFGTGHKLRENPFSGGVPRVYNSADGTLQHIEDTATGH